MGSDEERQEDPLAGLSRSSRPTRPGYMPQKVLRSESAPQSGPTNDLLPSFDGYMHIGVQDGKAVWVDHVDWEKDIDKLCDSAIEAYSKLDSDSAKHDLVVAFCQLHSKPTSMFNKGKTDPGPLSNEADDLPSELDEVKAGTPNPTTIKGRAVEVSTTMHPGLAVNNHFVAAFAKGDGVTKESPVSEEEDVDE